MPAGQLTIPQVYDFARRAGFDDKGARIATCIASAESGRRPGAISKPNTNGTIDRGLYQINSVHKDVTDAQALDPLFASQWAFRATGGGKNFGRRCSPWCKYPACLALMPSVNTALAGHHLETAIEEKGVVGAVAGGVGDVASNVDIASLDPTGIIGFGRTVAHGIAWLSDAHNVGRVLMVLGGFVALVVGVYVITDSTKAGSALIENVKGGAKHAAELAAVA